MDQVIYVCGPENNLPLPTPSPKKNLLPAKNITLIIFGLEGFIISYKGEKEFILWFKKTWDLNTYMYIWKLQNVRQRSEDVTMVKECYKRDRRRQQSVKEFQ